MYEILKQLATPAIINRVNFGFVCLFPKEKKKNIVNTCIKINKKNFKELVVYADELVDKGITNPDLEKLLFKISQKN